MEREKVYIMRGGEIEHVWEFKKTLHGFMFPVYVRGTHTEVTEYISSEFPEGDGLIHAMNDGEVEMIGALGIPVYIAPKLPEKR